MNTTAIIWLVLCGAIYAAALVYCLRHRYKRKIHSELIMGVAGFLVVFVVWSMYTNSLSWPCIIASTWFGLSSGLGFGMGTRYFDEHFRGIQ
jgi:hypothetical protein